MTVTFAQESLFYVENASANTHPLKRKTQHPRRLCERRSLGQRLRGAAGARHGGDLLQSVNLRVGKGDKGRRGQNSRVRGRRASIKKRRARARGANESVNEWNERVERRFRRTVRSGRAAAQRLATVFACCWKIPLTDVDLSPTVMTAAVGFLSATPLMPTPACARPETGKTEAR